MEESNCENCGDKFGKISFYQHLKDPNTNIWLCDDCADLPISKIKRKKKRELRRIDND